MLKTKKTRHVWTKCHSYTQDSAGELHTPTVQKWQRFCPLRRRRDMGFVHIHIYFMFMNIYIIRK